MLRYRQDRRTLVYLGTMLAAFAYQWSRAGLFDPWLYPFTLVAGIAAAVISHNHNHVGIWKSRTLNLLTSYVIGFFYGHPAIGWVPTHNLNHHKMNNREGDLSISPRVFKGNHLLSLIVYPTVTSLAQTRAIRAYLWELRTKNRRLFREAVSEYVVFFGLVALFLVLNWKKAIFLILIPQQVALFVIQCFNFWQHIECDKHSEWNHSRNFVGAAINACLFNNGFHTVHHFKPGVHWSLLPDLHAGHVSKVDASLNIQRAHVWFFTTYISSLLTRRLSKAPSSV